MSFGLDEQKDEHPYYEQDQEENDFALGGAALVTGCLSLLCFGVSCF